MKKYLVVCLFVSCSGVNAQQGYGSDVGGVSCSVYVKDYNSKRQAFTDPYWIWSQGYFSRLNKHHDIRSQTSADRHTFLDWMYSHCQRDPTSSVAAGAMNFYMSRAENKVQRDR
jgi:hypothetical protein